MSNLLNFNKEQFLKTAKAALQQGLLTNNDIQSLIIAKSSTDENKVKKNDQASIFVKFLAVFGTLIVILGILFLVGLLWDSLGDAGQIAITLGLGIVSFISGTALLKLVHPRFVGLSLHTIGFFAIPTGIFVSLSKLPPSSVDTNLVIFLVFSTLSIVYLVTDYLLKSQLFTLATILFGSIAYWAGVFLIFDTYTFWNDFEWPLLLYSLPLIVPSRFIVNNYREKVLRFFEGVGWIAGLSAIWIALLDKPAEFLLAFIYAFAVFAGIKIKSTTLLVISSIMFTSFLCYINFRYFSEYISWPIALIFSGGILIGSGYFLANSIKKIKG